MENQDSRLSRKRRTWRKLHLGVNEATGEIVSAVVSTNDVIDHQIFCDLLDRVEGEITQVSGDGAYDKYNCYEKASQLGAKPTIPPRKDAVIWQHGNCKGTPHPRDENLRRIRLTGRIFGSVKVVTIGAPYLKRQCLDFFVIFGGKLRRRKFDNQAVELFIQCAVLNRMIQNCKPESYKVAF